MQRLALVLWIAGFVLIAAGFLGLDRWFYENVSRQLNHDHPQDFYQTTKPFWEVCRLWSHWTGGLIAFFAVLAFHPYGRRTAVAGFAAVLATGILATTAQFGIGRLRPNEADSHLAFTTPFARFIEGDAAKGVAFPSGEAATAFAMAWVLSTIWPRGRWVFYVIAVLVVLARLLPGMHYISDVTAGAMLGTVIAASVYKAILPPLTRLDERLFGKH